MTVRVDLSDLFLTFQVTEGSSKDTYKKCCDNTARGLLL